MVSVRVLAREEWEAQLHALNCKRHDGPIKLKSAEVWENEHGRIFTVPMDNAQGRLRLDDLAEVVIEVRRLKPLNLDDK